MLEYLRNYWLYANLKKCRFYQEEVRFFAYIVPHQGIQIEKKQIKTVHNEPEPQLVRDIQVFLGFINFY